MEVFDNMIPGTISHIYHTILYRMDKMIYYRVSQLYDGICGIIVSFLLKYDNHITFIYRTACWQKILYSQIAIFQDTLYRKELPGTKKDKEQKENAFAASTTSWHTYLPCHRVNDIPNASPNPHPPWDAAPRPWQVSGAV